MRKRSFGAGLACLLVAALGLLPPGAAAAAPRNGVARPAAPAPAGPEMRAYMRRVLRQTQDPARVAALLAARGVRFLGYQAVGVRFTRDADGRPTPWLVETVTMGPDLVSTVQQEVLAPAPAGQDGPGALAGRKSDFLLRQWLYEWANQDGTFTEENVTTGTWYSPEWRWMARPADVIDVRWIVGDLAYVAAYPYDGVTFDQQTQGAASFTVDDLVDHWTVFVDFTPASRSVYGKVTNVFANYTHTYLGFKLSITLNAGPTGSTGSVSVNTDARTWVKGTGLALRIGSRESRGPASSASPVP